MAKKRSGALEPNVYSALIEWIFFKHYEKGKTEFEFDREELVEAADELGRDRPKNLGDVLYSFRYRNALPQTVLATATEGKEWVIEGAGIGKHKFKLARLHRIVPSPNAYQIKIPDATPEVINMYANSDEQALLAKVRYNRLIDTFLRITAYSLQNHLRTTVKGIGQIEIDELYVGVRNTGQQFVIPVQAKGGKDQIGATQILQDLAFCREAFPGLTARAVAVQFVGKEVIVMFELAAQEDGIKVVEEKHYRLVGAGDISTDDLMQMAGMSD
jgi:hypothetical protein